MSSAPQTQLEFKNPVKTAKNQPYAKQQLNPQVGIVALGPRQLSDDLHTWERQPGENDKEIR